MQRVRFRQDRAGIVCRQRHGIEAKPCGTGRRERGGVGARASAAPRRGLGRLLTVAGVLLVALVMLSGCDDHVIRGTPVGEDASGHPLYQFCYDVCRYGNCEPDAFCKVKTHPCELSKAMIAWPCGQ